MRIKFSTIPVLSINYFAPEIVGIGNGRTHSRNADCPSPARREKCSRLARHFRSFLAARRSGSLPASAELRLGSEKPKVTSDT